MSSKLVAHVVATATDPSKATANLLFHQETNVDGKSETTETAYWTYRNFVNSALYNSTLNLTEATFKLHIEEQGVVIDVTLYNDSDAEEEEPPAPTIKVV